MAINFCDETPGVIAGLTTFTPTIPKFYWDVDSQEQGVKQIAKVVKKVVDFLNDVTVQVNTNTADIEELRETIDAVLPQLDARISALEKALETLLTSMVVYDPTKGLYTNSADQSRRMLQLLGNPSDSHLTVQTIVDNGFTVSELAEIMCGTLVNDDFKRMAGIDMPYQGD